VELRSEDVYRLIHGSARHPANSPCSIFEKWVASGEELDDGSARYMAFICVGEQTVNHVLEMRNSGEAPEKGDPFSFMALELGSIDEEEDEVSIGIGYIIPRAYLMIEDPRWWIICRDDGDVSLP